MKIRWRGLRIKIIAWSFVPTAIILLTVALVTFFAFQSVTEELVLARDRDATYASANQLAQKIAEYGNTLTSLARRADIYQNDAATQRDALTRAANRLAVFDGGVLLLDVFGTVVASEPERQLEGQDWSDRSYYQKVVRSLKAGSSFGLILSDIESDGPNGSDVIVFAVPVIGEREQLQGTLVGMFQVEPSATNSFYGDIVRLRAGESGNTYLVDYNGRLIYHSDTGKIGEDFNAQPVVHRVLSGEVNAVRTHASDGQDIVAGFAPVPGTSWGLVAEETWDALSGGYRGYQNFLLFLLALGVVVPALVVAVGVRRITKPMTDLSNAAQEVARGNFGQKITAGTGDELEELADHFNLMSAQLEESYANLEQKVEQRTADLEQRNAELAVINSMQAGLVAELEMQAIYDLVGDQVYEFFDVQGVDIVTYHHGAKQVHFNFSLKNGERFYREPIPFTPLDSHLIKSHRPALINENVEENFSELGLVLTQDTQIPKSALIVPLVVGDAVKGSISLHNLNREHAFSDGDVRLLTTLTNSMSVALENARLFHETQRAQAEAEASRADAERANTAKSVFLANMSHELRTPLNAIIGFTRIVKRRGAKTLPEKQTQNLDKVLVSAEHLLGLINSILDIAKIEAGRMDVQPTIFNPKALVDVCAATAQPLVVQGVKLVKEVAADLPPIYSDQDKVKQILLNLLSNAAKFTHKGQITIGACRQDEMLVLSVADTGIGISEEALPRVFEEFQQADSSTTRHYGGTGLGLPISRNLARLLGGDLIADSIPGVGSTFTLTVPVRFYDV